MALPGLAREKQRQIEVMQNIKHVYLGAYKHLQYRKPPETSVCGIGAVLG